MEQELLQGVQARDEAALAALYDRYGGLVYTVALRVVGDPHLAQEVLQDTFLRAWNSVEQYDPARGQLSAWLVGVARNRAVDVLRGRQHQARLRERESTPAGAAANADVEAAGDALLLQQAVTSALATLPGAQRQAIELAYYGGLSQSEIARTTGAPLGTVKTRMRDGLGRLRDLLRPWATPDTELARRD